MGFFSIVQPVNVTLPPLTVWASGVSRQYAPTRDRTAEQRR